ncbi:MAG: sugar phosphate isomerase/epimerase [Spirochaetales bacterium]|nr:sugar phosphate isomerase/epimerase [Spirochaetales bacterium]
MAADKSLIPLGTMIRGGEKTRRSLERFIPIGIESVQIFFWEVLPETADLSWMEETAAVCRQKGILISALGLYANPLRDLEHRDKAAADWTLLLDFASRFDIPVVSGFTGRIPGTPLEKSYEGVRDFFTPITEACLAKNLKLAFENCSMEGDQSQGDWNIAFLPEVWELLLNDYFPDRNIGLEYEPGHLVRLGIPASEPVRQWKHRIHHIHGKDAPALFADEFCFPGEGVSDWPNLLEELKSIQYQGTLDLEGYHGQFVSHEQEKERQVRSLDYLRTCF